MVVVPNIFESLTAVRGQKKRGESQLGFLNDYSLFCQTLWGPKRQSIHVFVKKFLSTLLHPFGTFLPFIDLWGLKKRSFSHL